MITILLGILSSTAAEVVTALNKRLQGTVLKGDAAFLVAFAMALPAAIIKEAVMPGFHFSMLFDWTTLVKDFGEVFAISQVYFIFIVQKLCLDVETHPTDAQPVVPVIAGV